MLHTRTGSFPIGFRRGWSAWQQDLNGLIGWAKENQFGVIDLGGDADVSGAAVAEAGLRIGSADLKNWSGFISADESDLATALSENLSYIPAAVKHGATNFFTVMLPKDASKPRAENFALMVTGLKELAKILEANNAKLVIEGWPGAGALCCTPETYRAAIEQVGSSSIGINYDPSHLIRLGVDPIRFLREFKDFVYHVHGKDTEVYSELVYELGLEQPAAFAKGHDFGSPLWRYTIPGHGQMRWTTAFEILAENGYKGAVSIELEDENFNGSEAGEKHGLIASGSFLASA
jgi:sugar phosphate isomerase/epimerase